MLKSSKLIYGLTALSLLMPTAYAKDEAEFESGFYAGIKLGGSQGLAKWQESSSTASGLYLDGLPTIVGTLDQQHQGDSNETNFMGNVAVGYQYIFEELFLLAAEFSININSEQELGMRETINNTTILSGTDIVSYTENLDSNVEIENPDIIFDLRPGFLLAEDFVIYGRIGVAFNELSATQQGSVAATCEQPFYCATPVDNNISIYSKTEDNVAALRLGLGLEYKLTENLGINADYVYTDYRSISTAFNPPSVSQPVDGSQDFITDVSMESEAEVTKNIWTLGLNWYF